MPFNLHLSFLGLIVYHLLAIKRKAKEERRKRKKEKKEDSPSWQEDRQKFGCWHGLSGFISTASKRHNELCNLLVNMTIMTQKQNCRREGSRETGDLREEFYLPVLFCWSPRQVQPKLCLVKILSLVIMWSGEHRTVTLSTCTLSHKEILNVRWLQKTHGHFIVHG